MKKYKITQYGIKDGIWQYETEFEPNENGFAIIGGNVYYCRGALLTPMPMHKGDRDPDFITMNGPLHCYSVKEVEGEEVVRLLELKELFRVWNPFTGKPFILDKYIYSDDTVRYSTTDSLYGEYLNLKDITDIYNSYRHDYLQALPSVEEHNPPALVETYKQYHESVLGMLEHAKKKEDERYFVAYGKRKKAFFINETQYRKAKEITKRAIEMGAIPKGSKVEIVLASWLAGLGVYIHTYHNAPGGKFPEWTLIRPSGRTESLHEVQGEILAREGLDYLFNDFQCDFIKTHYNIT